MLETTSDLVSDLVQGSAYWTSGSSDTKQCFVEGSNGSVQLPRSDTEDSLEDLLIE